MIRYDLELSRQKTLSFAVDETGWSCDQARAGRNAPPWARLDSHRCDHCTLPDGPEALCPAALAISPVIEAFAGNFSYEQVEVRVESENRVLQARVSLQEAIRSLMGLLLALSACPVMMGLRPMARFHLPFGDREHTLFRVVGMYLIAQHLRAARGLAADRGLEGLGELYRKIHVVNERMAARLALAAREDAAVNGLVILDVFAQGVEVNLANKLSKLEALFGAYLQ